MWLNNVRLKVKKVGHLSESCFLKEKPEMLLQTEFNFTEELDRMQEPISLDEGDEKLVFNA